MLNLEKFLEKYFSKDDKIILACSSGPDSMFLLYELLKTTYKDNLVVCYFNHKLRTESEEEEAFLEDLWKKLGFQVEIWYAYIKEIQAKIPSKNLEELAREKRYAFFDTILHIYKAKYILTAHHLDDKIETFFFNLTRWSKLTGLINMTEKSSIILRPLLDITKLEILEYLDKNNLKYFIDKSNFESDFSRNYLRNEIIPKFEKLNFQFKNNIKTTLNYFEELKFFIDEEVKKFLETPLTPLVRGGKSSFSDKRKISEGQREFQISSFNSLSTFLQKEVIRYIYYISNWNSTIWLSEANIAEIIKFINWKWNKTIKEIKLLKMKKDWDSIFYIFT